MSEGNISIRETLKDQSRDPGEQVERGENIDEKVVELKRELEEKRGKQIVRRQKDKVKRTDLMKELKEEQR